MTPRLLDVNLLIALAWPNHVHHAPAHRWFSETGRKAWATCPITHRQRSRLRQGRCGTGEAILAIDPSRLIM